MQLFLFFFGKKLSLTQLYRFRLAKRIQPVVTRISEQQKPFYYSFHQPLINLKCTIKQLQKSVCGGKLGQTKLRKKTNNEVKKRTPTVNYWLVSACVAHISFIDVLSYFGSFRVVLLIRPGRCFINGKLAWNLLSVLSSIMINSTASCSFWFQIMDIHICKCHEVLGIMENVTETQCDFTKRTIYEYILSTCCDLCLCLVWGCSSNSVVMCLLLKYWMILKFRWKGECEGCRHIHVADLAAFLLGRGN